MRAFSARGNSSSGVSQLLWRAARGLGVLELAAARAERERPQRIVVLLPAVSADQATDAFACLHDRLSRTCWADSSREGSPFCLVGPAFELLAYLLLAFALPPRLPFTALPQQVA